MNETTPTRALFDVPAQRVVDNAFLFFGRVPTKEHNRTDSFRHVQQRYEAPRDRFLCPLVKEVEECARVNALDPSAKLVEAPDVLERRTGIVRYLRERSKFGVEDVPDEKWDGAGVAVGVECVTQVDKILPYIAPDYGRGGVSRLDDVTQVRAHYSRTS